jgi:hypothetical protein
VIAPSDLDNRFAFHPANTDEKRQAHEAVRELFRKLAEDLNSRVPDGREKGLAYTSIEQAMFWSNAAIARDLKD